MKPFLRLLATVILFLCALPHARAAQNRFYLAEQDDFGAKTGFYLDFENASEGSAPCPLTSLKMILGVGDGQGWRFLTTPPGQPWQYDHEYAVKAVVTPRGAQLWLDGRKIADSPGAFRPIRDAVLAGLIPEWAHDPAEYLIQQRSLEMTPSGGKPLRVSFASEDARPLALQVFEPQTPRRIENWSVPPGATLTVTAAFRLTHSVTDLHTLAPLIDRYGQAIAADWPGKVRSDADLERAAADETRRLRQWPAPAGHDRFGGLLDAGWHEKPTGVYGVARHQGFWWLVSPEGHPVFYDSLSSVPSLTFNYTPVTGREFLFQWLPPRDGPTAVAWGRDAWGEGAGVEYVAFPAVTMLHKYGPQWQETGKALAARRLRAWGFTGMGKWSDSLPGVPNLPVLSRGDVPNVARHPDIFDPAVQAKFEASLRRQIEPDRSNPLIVGWSLGNEYDEIITAAEIDDILKKPAAVPAKRALVNYAVDTLYHGDAARAAQAAGVTAPTRDSLYATPLKFPDADRERLRRFYADRYYDWVYRTVKRIDPKHLYFGFWIVPGWWENEEDWRLIAPHCDVIGYDRYAFQFADDTLTRLMRETAKPVFCGEFSYPPLYDGRRGFGLYNAAWAEDEAESGALYARWLDAAARSPYCVGVSWFQYRDEPLTGRGPGSGPQITQGEHFAFGLVDGADRPKWGLLSRIRAANLRAARTRLAASQARSRP